jgi:hypothetical protein
MRRAFIGSRRLPVQAGSHFAALRIAQTQNAMLLFQEEPEIL